MSTLLQSKQIIYGDLTQQSYTIDTFLGAGTQGEVYRAHANEQEVAIKWYRSEERRVGKECRSRWSPYH